MPRRFFRKFALKRENLSGRWWAKPIESLLHHPELWAIRRRSVVPAFALGVFVAFLPFPLHMLTAAIAAVYLRVNVPVASTVVWISNPLTMGPIFYAAYELGRRLLKLPAENFSFDFSIDWLTSSFAQVWQPLLLGSLLMGVVFAVISYIALDLLWRGSISDYRSRKRKEREQRNRQA